MKLPTNEKYLKPSRELLIQVDNIGQITLISDNCYEILGFKQDEFMNTFIDTHLGYSFDELLSQPNTQVSISNKDGKNLFFDMQSEPLFDEEDKIVGVHLSLINISKYVQMEKQCNQIIKIIKKTKDIVFTFQILPEFKFIYVSPSIREIFGYDAELYYSNPYFPFEHVHPDDAEIQKRKVDKHTDFSKPFCVRFKHKNGHYVWIEDYVIPTFDDNGELLSVSGISRDITVRKQLEEKLKEQKRALEIDVLAEIESNKLMEKTMKDQEELFVNISHELKTPLNVISSAVQLIDMFYKKGTLENNKDILIKHINSIKLNSFRLCKLINNIVDTSKIEAGFFELNLSNNNIVELVEEIVTSLFNFTELKGLNIIFDTDIEEKIMACDPEKIERIVLNLISNAIKFSNKGDEIFVNIKDMDEFVEISVEDSGIGIEKEHLDVIFNRFKQVDKSLSRNAEGAGIGLSLVKSIVELHSGSISVESEYGKGSKFTVVLPARAVTEQHKLFNKNLNNKTESIQVEFSDVYS